MSNDFQHTQPHGIRIIVVLIQLSWPKQDFFEYPLQTVYILQAAQSVILEQRNGTKIHSYCMSRTRLIAHLSLGQEKNIRLLRQLLNQAPR